GALAATFYPTIVITRTGHPPGPSWWASPVTIEGISCGGGGAELFWLPGNRNRVRPSGLAVTKQELLTGSGIPLRSNASTFLAAGRHACLARSSRLDLRGNPRAPGLPVRGERVKTGKASS